MADQFEDPAFVLPPLEETVPIFAPVEEPIPVEETAPAPIEAVPAPVEATTGSYEITNVELADLLSSNRTILSQEQADFTALEGSLTDQITAFNAKIVDAIETEKQETMQLLALNQSVDEAALSNRATQLAQAEYEFDAKMAEYEKAVRDNNNLAAVVFGKFNTNIRQLQAVKGQIATLKGKLDRFSAIVDTCTGKK